MIQLPDPDYHQNVIMPYLATRSTKIEQLALPMIEESYNKEAALPPYLWGLIWENWQPDPHQGNTVFLQGMSEDRNWKKRVYYSAVTPDLYRDKYRGKVQAFFRDLLGANNQGLPLMKIYLDEYLYLYWDLHLGVPKKLVPPYVREVGECFMYCLARLDPFDRLFHRNYMQVRRLRPQLDAWINRAIADLEGSDASKSTFVHYWRKNSKNDPRARREDVVFECFHNFLAFSQWGHMIYRIMEQLEREVADTTVRDWFEKIMEGGFDQLDHPRQQCPFTPLDRFVMELFRIAMPNTGSISVQATSGRLHRDAVYTIHDHVAISRDPLHWSDPEAFNPDRYVGLPTSDQIDSEKCRQLGFQKCPYHQSDFPTQDGRGSKVTNSGFGTVYNKHGGKEYPVCDYAGYSPFGFGYRRCPGELFTIEFFKEFLRQIWDGGIEFLRLPAQDAPIPIAPGTFVADDIGFDRTAPRTKNKQGGKS